MMLITDGEEAGVVLSGTPCSKIEKFQKVLRIAVTEHRYARPPTLKRALLAIVVTGGLVSRDDRIVIHIAGGPHRALKPV
jgi:hypothetical protein